MIRRATRLGLALVMLALPLVGTRVLAGDDTPTGTTTSELPGGISKAHHAHARPFKLKGGGQIDLTTYTFEFAGKATHIGKYDAIGQIDQYFNIQGTMTGKDGDVIDWTATFQIGPLGEIEATFNITGGTGKFLNAAGQATGPVALDPDQMFTITLEGTITY